jgi:hypothetical protein
MVKSCLIATQMTLLTTFSQGLQVFKFKSLDLDAK